MKKPFGPPLVTIVLGAQMMPAIAQTLYSDGELAERAPLYETWLAGVFKEDLIGQLPGEDRSALSDVGLLTPTGVIEDAPLTVGADPGRRIVVLPIQTVAFLDDMAALSAWLTWDDCSQEPATVYAAMLTATDPPSADGFYPNPRAAFGLDDSVWDDQRVKNTSNQIFNTAVYFVLAHELGHIKHAHPASDKVAASMAQEDEIEADAFALESMRHVGVPPLGMIVYFMVRSRMETGVAKTHPLSGSRLARITAALRTTPEEFVPRGEDVNRWAPILGQQAALMDDIVDVVDDPRLREELARQAKEMSWSALPDSCDIVGIR